MGKFGGFQSGGGMGNIQNLMKQAQKMQADMQRKQAEVSVKEIEVSSGGGAVKVKALGNKTIKSIEISKDLVAENDVEMIQDLVLTAVNEALNKADGMMNEGMDGFNIPGLM